MIQLDDKNYVERDLSWMYFNQRILAEAKRDDLPLMERLNMLGIYSNNLDEFFRVRVSRLNDKSDKELLDTINNLNADMAVDFRNTIHAINDALKKENIMMVRSHDIAEGHKSDFLTPQQQAMMVVQYGLRDNSHAYIVDGNTNNKRASGDEVFRSQEELYKYYLSK